MKNSFDSWFLDVVLGIPKKLRCICGRQVSYLLKCREKSKRNQFLAVQLSDVNLFTHETTKVGNAHKYNEQKKKKTANNIECVPKNFEISLWNWIHSSFFILTVCFDEISGLHNSHQENLVLTEALAVVLLCYEHKLCDTFIFHCHRRNRNGHSECVCVWRKVWACHSVIRP